MMKGVVPDNPTHGNCYHSHWTRHRVMLLLLGGPATRTTTTTTTATRVSHDITNSEHSTCTRDARYCSKGADGTSLEEDHGCARSERVTHVVKER